MSRDLKSKWKQRTVLAVLSLIVAFTVIYLLIQPASSMTDSVLCDRSEHVHSEACYEWHSGTLEHALTCHFENPGGSISHIHDSSCYNEDGLLFCPMEERTHIHETSCYQDGQLVCGTVIHQHDENCFTILTDADGAAVLICGTGMHQHTESCYALYVSAPLPVHEEQLAEQVYSASMYEDGSDDADTPDAFVPIAEYVPALTALSPDAIEICKENNTINGVTLSYQDYNEQIEITKENCTSLAADAYYQILVGYKNITVSQVKNAGNQMKYGPVPDWFVPDRSGSLFYGDKAVGTIEVTDSYFVITFNEDWLNTQQNSTVLNGSFKANGSIDWTKVQNDGKTDSNFPSLDFTVGFEEDLYSKYGDVQIEKSLPAITEIDGRYFLRYELTVTSGESEVVMPDITVKDSFTANAGYIAGYVGITSGCVSPAGENLEPAESSSEETFQGGSWSMQDGSMLWDIGELQPGEVRTLIYYAELREEYVRSLITSSIRNSAEVSSNKIPKHTASSTFTPKLNVSVTKKLTDITQLHGGTGTGPVSYEITISASESNSFTLKGLALTDAFPEELKDFISGDDDGYITVTVEGREPVKVSFQDASFTLPELTLAPGETKHITYTVYLTNIFTAQNETIELTNTARLSGGGRTLAFASNTKELDRSALIRKISGAALSSEQEFEIPWQDGVFGYDGDSIISADNPGSFTVPAGSLQYQVVLNEDGSWNLTYTNMEDSFENPYLKYVGYVQLQVFEEPAVESGTLISDNELISQLNNTPASRTVWLYVDGQGSFTFKPNQLGLDNVKGCTLLLTYYARIMNAENIGSFDGGNSFSIWGDVGAGNGIARGAMKVTVSKVMQGGVSYSAEKTGWYYEPDQVYRTDGVGSSNYPESEFNSDYVNGALYWIIRLEGTIPAGSSDGYGTSNKKVNGFYIADRPDVNTTNLQYFKKDAVVGVFVGAKSFDMTQYGSFAEFAQDGYGGLEKLRGNPCNDKYFHKNDTLVNEPDYEWFAESEYIQGIYFPDGYPLKGNEALYIVVRATLTLYSKNLPTGSQTYKLFDNKLEIFSGGSSFEAGTAEFYYSPKSSLYKQSMGAYIYDAQTRTWKDSPADNGCTPWYSYRPTDQWPAAAKNAITESGLYAEWLLNVNWNGGMEGTAMVSDYLPEGMELEYVDIFWLGSGARSPRPTCEEIPELENSEEWIKLVDEANSKGWGKAISYYNPTTREIRWKISNLTKRSEQVPTFDKYQMNLQIICRVTDYDVMLSRDGKTFTNSAVTGHCFESDAVTINKNGSMNKDINMDYFSEHDVVGDLITGTLNVLPFKIEINPYGEDLCEGDHLPALIDELGKGMELVEESLAVTYADGTPVKGYSYSVRTAEEGQQTMILYNLPDNRKLIISYNTRITAGKNTVVEITNNAYWNGYSTNAQPQVHDKKFQYNLSGIVEITEAEISVTISKVDSENHSKKLYGAEFSLFAAELQDDRIEETFLTSGATGLNGKLILKNEEQYLHFNKLYCIRETRAPNGYVLDETPHYFIISNDASNDFSVYEQRIAGLVIWYENPQYTWSNVKGRISVEKQFWSEGGDPIAPPISGSYQFGLYDTQGELLEVLTIEYTPEGPRYYLDNVLQEIPAGENPYFTNYDPESVCFVYELDGSGHPIIHDSLGNVSGRTYLVSYYVGDGPVPDHQVTVNDTIRIVNQAHSILMPASGGIGSGIYYFAGGVIIFLSLTPLLYVRCMHLRKSREELRHL